MHASVTDVGELRFPRQFLLWSVRQWCHAPDRDRGTALVREAFQRMSMNDAYLALDALLSTLLASTPRPMCWRCPNARFVSDDEWALLDAIAILQSGAEDLVRCRWSMSWPENAVHIAIDAATRLARGFTEAGLMLGVPGSILLTRNHGASGSSRLH